MRNTVIAIAGSLLMAATTFAADDVVTAVAGTVKKVDAGTKTFVVETGRGTEHTFHYTDQVSIHGARDIAKTPGEFFKGLKTGGRVAVHYSAKGSEETAHEVDVIGRSGLKVTEGTVTRIDRGSKIIAVKTAEGTEETFRLTDHAARDSAKGIAKGTGDSAKVTVYYTEDAGKKVAHFFEE